jgi:hypothetical protein
MKLAWSNNLSFALSQVLFGEVGVVPFARAGRSRWCLCSVQKQRKCRDSVSRCLTKDDWGVVAPIWLQLVPLILKDIKYKQITSNIRVNWAFKTQFGTNGIEWGCLMWTGDASTMAQGSLPNWHWTLPKLLVKRSQTDWSIGCQTHFPSLEHFSDRCCGENSWNRTISNTHRIHVWYIY